MATFLKLRITHLALRDGDPLRMHLEMEIHHGRFVKVSPAVRNTIFHTMHGLKCKNFIVASNCVHVAVCICSFNKSAVCLVFKIPSCCHFLDAAPFFNILIVTMFLELF